MQWAYQPSLALGGDLFQVSSWGEDALGLYILDASGHGVSAALRAVALMSFLREDNLAKAVGSLDPGAIITEANRLFPLTQDGEYFTLWVGRLDISSRMLSYATAGHGGAFLQAAGNGSRWLSMASLPLGFDPHSTFESMHSPLLSSDRLYLFSDGIYEAPSPTGELWGRERLQASLEAHRSHSLAQSIAGTMATARQWLAGDVFPDDVALLGLEMLESPTCKKERV